MLLNRTAAGIAKLLDIGNLFPVQKRVYQLVARLVSHTHSSDSFVLSQRNRKSTNFRPKTTDCATRGFENSVKKFRLHIGLYLVVTFVAEVSIVSTFFLFFY